KFPTHWYGPGFTIRSLTKSEFWAAAWISACVHGPLLICPAGAGAGTVVQLGEPVDAACTSLPVVTIPTTPSTAIPAAGWNHRIACVVLGPSFPSIVPALQPSAFSARWSDSTAAASLVLLAGAPKAADDHASTDAVTTAVTTHHRAPRPRNDPPLSEPE